MITTTFSRLKDHINNHAFDFLLTTPVDPELLTPKEVAAEYGAWLAQVRWGEHFEETELLLHNEWMTRKKGLAELKLPPNLVECALRRLVASILGSDSDLEPRLSR
jgi:hypothetical protein